MRRFLLISLLALLATAALAGDLERQLSPAALQPILAQLQKSTHRHFAIIDYSLRSDQPRFRVYRRQSQQLIASFRVAHGRGSDIEHDGYAKLFSDATGSHASSLGLFRTAQVYASEEPGHGRSMRLIGLSDSNRNAERRAIVIHANHYMEQAFIGRHGLPGRSHGCLVFAARDRDAVLELLQGGALIFAIRQNGQALARQ
ncbi:MAG: murein L,D-transpeptidase catalytic domain-containing protein [Pseudomonas sp.]